MKETRKMWITWHFAARSRNLAKALDIPIFELFITKNLLSRHILSSFWTIWILLKKRPNVVFLQLSFLLLLIVVFYKIFRFNRVTIVADCHTKALRRTAPGIINYIFWPLKKWSFQLVNIAIVSNKGMIKSIKKLHHKYFIIPDKIPDANYEFRRKKSERYCVYVSSFAVDEPIDEIFYVAELLKQELKIYWTGRPSKKLISNVAKPANLVFTGYLDYDDYWNLIRNADCMLALTTEEDCLQSAAYEALSVEVPMVISDTKALREFFQKTAIYTLHQPDKIAESIRFAIKNRESLIDEIRLLKNTRNKELKKLLSMLGEMVNV